MKSLSLVTGLARRSLNEQLVLLSTLFWVLLGKGFIPSETMTQIAERKKTCLYFQNHETTQAHYYHCSLLIFIATPLFPYAGSYNFISFTHGLRNNQTPPLGAVKREF